ncbi:hypothetical protein Tco_0565987 [Tanacetum coccineum]
MRKYTLLRSDANYARDHTIRRIVYKKKKEKTLKEAYYTQFGAPYHTGGQYRAAGPGFYKQNNRNSSYPDQRPSLEESLTKFMAESAKRHEENSHIIKDIRASTDAAIRNQGASIKTLEIQIGQMSKIRISDVVHTSYREHITGAYFLKQFLFQDDCKTSAVMIRERHKMRRFWMLMITPSSERERPRELYFTLFYS